MRRLRLQLIAAFAAVLLGLGGTLAAQAVPAIVRGVPLLNVRRGAGTEHAPFTTVHEGERVEVERVAGGWALIRTTRGETGYVNTTYLNFLGAEPPREAAAPEATAALEAAAAATALPATDVEALVRRNAELEAENQSLRQQLAQLPGAPTPSEVAGEAGDGTAQAAGDPQPGDVRGDVRRLLDLTEQMQRQLSAAQGNGEQAAPSRFPSAQSIWVLLGTGIIAGGLLGNYYGRRGERSKRNRIRF